MKVNNVVCSFLFILAFIGCSSTTRNADADAHSNSNDPVVRIARFDRDIYHYLNAPSKALADTLTGAYPTLLAAFGISTINTDLNTDRDVFFLTLQNYFSHPMLKDIYKKASYETFVDVTEIEHTLSAAQMIVGQKMPNRHMPQFAMHVSGFKENSIVVDGIISLSIDKYVGSDYVLYQSFFAPYQRQQMKPEYVVRDFLKAWLLTDINPSKDDDDLLKAMIVEGKILYILSVLLPNFTPNNLIGYTDEQIDWCNENERKVWDALLKKKDIYSQESSIISKYIGDAPYTKAVAEKSPGRMGCWLGWQIVDGYMKHSNSSINDLIATDGQSILKLSKYNP